MIAIYARVSTAEQAQEGYSIDEQVERLRKYCEAQGRADTASYVDAGYSGANTKRPALLELISDVERGRIDKVLVYKLDRLSRSQKDTLRLIEDVFLANGCEFESMTERFDTGTSFGRAMVGILAVFAQLEREQIKERLQMGKTGRAKEGRYHGGGHLPYGYKYVDGDLVVDEGEALLVREVFKLYLEGKTVAKIASMLNERGLSGRTNKGFRGETIKRILSNPVCVGMITHNGELYTGSHEHIISDEDFQRVQDRLRMYEGSRAPSIRQRTVLTGLVYCARCGARYACTAHGADNRYRYYSCYSRRKVVPSMVRDAGCRNKIYRVEALDEIVFNELRKLALDADALEDASKGPAESEGPRKLLEAEIKKLDDQCSRYLDLYGLGKFSIEQLTAKTDPLMEQRQKLAEELERLESEDKGRLSKEYAREVISSMADVLEAGSVDEVRLVVQTLIERIDIDGEDVIIHWRF